jgi:hypothetical protein
MCISTSDSVEDFESIIGASMDSGTMLIAQMAAVAVAAYVGAYWAKGGQNKAIHRDLDKLLDQTYAVTQATKSIEAAIF